ncbi:hypothetical protein [Vibrio parahaemolyticus]|uniref:hypothetical protein n=1 Tax=Vibrio parahaemolyticus TaxID=670 RepID=UPI00301B7B3A
MNLKIECLGSFVLREWWGRDKDVTVGKRYVLFCPVTDSPFNRIPYFLDDNGDPRSTLNGLWGDHEVVEKVTLKDAEKIIKHYREEEEEEVTEKLQEQPEPKAQVNSKAVVPEVMKDLTDRLAKGVETYGTPLTSHNGRDALQDLYEELLDAACYVKQLMMER